MSRISPENQQFIDESVASGEYDNRDAVVDTALDLLRKRKQLIRDVNVGHEQIMRGEYGPLDMDRLRRQVKEEFEQQDSSH